MELEIYRKGISAPIVVDVDEVPGPNEHVLEYLIRVMEDRTSHGMGRRLIGIPSLTELAESGDVWFVLAGESLGNMETKG